MKRESLTTKTATELHALLAEAQQKLAQMRFDLADKKLKRTSDIAMVRRQIARIRTVLRIAR